MLLWKLGYVYLFELVVFFIYILRNGIAESYGSSIFIFLRNFHFFSPVTASLYIPTNSAGGFPFSTSSPTFVSCVPFEKSHSDRCEVIPHCGFDLNFLMISDAEHIFMYPLDIFICSLEKHLFSSSAHLLIGLFVSFILSFMTCLYVLDISPYQS